MINIENKKSCSGCHACFNVCPVNAIEMNEDEYGFKYPIVDKDKCINCGLCEKVCSIIHKNTINNEPKAYAVINKDDNIRKQSSSGGVFSLIAEYVINNGGIVFGAKFDKNFDVIHSYTNTIDGLKEFRGSKYVQSIIGNTYKEARDFLNQGKLVLFTGTLCQIEGLKSFLQKDFNNLITQDIICHGVPSIKVWRKYKEFKNKNANEKLSNVNFRNKDNGWKSYNVDFKYVNKEFKINHNNDLFIKAFLSNICLRDSCYSCNFKKMNRVSDITLADFWGIDKIDSKMDDDKGTSLVIINSEKGKDIFNKISKAVIFKEVNLQDAIKYNPSMIKSVNMHQKRKEFFEDIDNLEFDILVKKYIKNKNIIIRILKKIKRILIHKKTTIKSRVF